MKHSERESHLNHFTMRMMVLGLIFQSVQLACTYKNDTIIELQKKADITDFPSKFTQKKVDSASKDN